MLINGYGLIIKIITHLTEPGYGEAGMTGSSMGKLWRTDAWNAPVPVGAR
jgi:hypothetical protein